MHKTAMSMAGLLLCGLLGQSVQADSPDQPPTSAETPAQAAPSPAAPSADTSVPSAAAAMPASKEAAGPPAKPEATVDVTADRIICKTKTESGSLGKRTRTCMTKREWDKQREENRRLMNDSFRNGYAGPGRSSRGGG